jgi:hypothetical protein
MNRFLDGVSNAYPSKIDRSAIGTVSGLHYLQYPILRRHAAAANRGVGLRPAIPPFVAASLRSRQLREESVNYRFWPCRQGRPLAEAWMGVRKLVHG